MASAAQKERLSAFIKERAQALGFLHCGIAKATFLEDEARRLEDWLNQNHHGKMGYMANHFDKRVDPTKLLHGAKSVISLSLNYHNPEKPEDAEAPTISQYAYGQDYHHVIKSKLRVLMEQLQEEVGDFHGRGFVDSAPVLDKAWAQRAGIGWLGKHSNLIAKNQGSYFFLAEIVLDVDLAYDQPFTSDHCGTCTQCIDACPTEAIIKPYVVDGSKCISYFTIELKDQLPQSMAGKFDNWMFGCDICQEVCPWNRFSKPHNEPLFNPHPDLLNMTKTDWESLSKEVFNEVFRKSAVKRTKYAGLQRNITFLEGKLKDS